jgi:hypothetical protein
LKLDFTAIAEACLWGNATDLSLLTSLSHDEIKQLQSVERGSKFLLKNDLGAVWEHVKGLKDARVDIVFDNVRLFPLLPSFLPFLQPGTDS